MKFSTYQPAVDRNTMNPPAVQASRDIMAYGTAGRDVAGLMPGLSLAIRVAQKKQDEADYADTMEAKNRVMTALTEGLYGEGGLLETGVGENAKGLTERTTQLIQKTYRDVAKDYNGRVQQTLMGNLNENTMNFQRMAAAQEKSERAKLIDSNYKNSIDTNINLAALNWDKPGMLDLALGDSMRTMNAQANLRGWSGKQSEGERRTITTDIVSGAVNAAIDAENYDAADEMLRAHRKDMDQASWNKLYSVIHKKQGTKQMALEVDGIADRCRNADGTIDLTKADAMIDQMYGRDAKKWISDGGNFSGDDKIDALISKYAQEEGVPVTLLAAMAKQESGYNQSAQSGAGAIGIMQLMPGTAEGLGVNPYDMEQNIKGGAIYLRQMLDNFDGDVTKAVAAYNAGPGAVEEAGGVPNYEETQNYVQSVLGYKEEFDSSPAGEGKGHYVSAYDPEKQDRMKSQIRARNSDISSANKQRENEFTQSVVSMIQNAGSAEAAENILTEQMDNLSPSGVSAARSAIRAYYGTSAGGGTSGGSSSDGEGGMARKTMTDVNWVLDNARTIIDTTGTIDNPGEGITNESNHDISKAYDSGVKKAKNLLFGGYITESQYNTLIERLQNAMEYYNQVNSYYSYHDIPEMGDISTGVLSDAGEEEENNE